MIPEKKEFTEREQMMLVLNNPSNIQKIQDPCEEAQLTAIKKDILTYCFIKNPTRKAIVKACTLYSNYIDFRNIDYDILKEIIEKSKNPINVIAQANSKNKITQELILIALDGSWNYGSYKIVEKIFPEIVKREDFQYKLKKMKLKNGTLKQNNHHKF